MSDAMIDRQPTLPIPVLLKGQKALVTGANSGIGKAIAIALSASGADVALNYVDGETAAQEVVNSIRALGGRAIAIKARRIERNRSARHVQTNDAGIRHHRHSGQQRGIAA